MPTRDQDGKPLPGSSPVSDHSPSFDSALSSTTELASETWSGLLRKAPPPHRDLPPLPELTPAAIVIVAQLRAFAAGTARLKADGASLEWKRFACTQNDWNALHAYLSALGPRDGQDKDKARDSLWGFFYDKVRLDAFCDKGFAVLRMPSPKHEVFIGGVEKYIENQIAAIQRRGSPRTNDDDSERATTSAEKVPEDVCIAGWYASQTRSLRSTYFHYEMSAASKGTHEPDTSFCFVPPGGSLDPPPIPGLIIEVSFANKRKDLRSLADHYLLGTADEDVNLVLCLDLEYGGKGGRVIAYRRKEEEENGRQVVSVEQTSVQNFMSSTGELIPGEFAFLLSDLGPKLRVPPEHQRIVLDFRHLYNCYYTEQSVEIHPRVYEEFVEPVRKGFPNRVKRCRESSSPEDETPLVEKFD